MDFSFFKPKEKISLDVDIHSHLIPAIDDGSQSMEESIVLLRSLETLGYKKVITTPHIMADRYKNTPQSIKKGLTALALATKNAGICIKLEVAAEYYLDEGFMDHLHQDDVLLIADKYLLFETSYIAKPLEFEKMIYEIQALGYTPLLAHPERYRYIMDIENEYQKLKSMGILFQVNINSFGGHYGKDAKRKALYLSNQGMVDFLGSDVHHIKQVETLGMLKKSAVYRRIFAQNIILNNTL